MAGDNAFWADVVPSNDADSPLLTGFETDTSVGINRNTPLGLSLESDSLIIDEQTRGLEVSGDSFVVPWNDLSSPNSLVQSTPLIVQLDDGSQPLAANVDQVTGLVNGGLLTNPILEALKGQVEPLYGDADFDDDVDDDDLAAVLKARNTLVTDPDGRQDLDGDGRITTLDARKLIVHLQSNTDFDAPDLDVALTKDTAPGGITNSDEITFELGITGTAFDSSLVTRLRAGIDDTPVENFVDILGAHQADGRFSLSREQLDAIYGAPLADGEHRFRLWAKDQWANQTGIVELTFTLDTVAPPLTLDLDPAFDTGQLGDQQTEIETVTLVGQTEPNLSVTLDETGDSTTADAAGQFSFTTIALQEGANTFTVRTADVAGNETVFTQVITRVVANTPPTVDPDKSLTVQEDNVTPLKLGAPTDVDNDALTITVTTTPDATKGELQLSDGTPVIVAQNLTAEELTQLVFSPVENATGEAGGFSYTVDDGQGGSASQTIALTIAPVNDAPVITLPTVDSVEAGTELTISGIAVSDVDAGEAQLEVTVSAVNGVLSLGQIDGLTFLTGDGLEDNTLVFTGTLAAINGALGSLVYRSDATFSGTETISLVVDDQGNSGEGGALSDAATIDVTVNPPVGILLVEGTDFNTNSEFSFTVPAEPAVLNFTYEDLNFDPTDLNAINDAFEVALVDAEGNSLIHTIGGSRDAFLNVTEGLEVATAAGVSVEDTVVTVNLAGVTPGTEAKLLMRLVNNDSDEATTVRIRDINVVETPGLTPPGGVTPGLATLSSDTVVDFEKLSDVSASLVADYSRTSFNEDTDTLFAGVTVRNAGQYGVDGPIVVAVDNLSDPAVRVVNADGVTPEGVPYYLLSEIVLAPGSTTSVGTNLEFMNSGGERFTYDLVFLGHLNEAPEIITEPNLEGSIGRPYRYDVDATDPEGDPVTYSLLLAPEGMTIDSETGVIEWDPQAADRGTQSITVQAADGRGGVTEQSFDLVVDDAPPNRPPVFTTGPVVDARVNTAYEYDADATDLDGDELTFALMDGPEGMTVDPETGQVIWTPTAEQITNGKTAITPDPTLPIVDGFTVEEYAKVTDPLELSFDQAGSLYVSRDQSGTSGNTPFPDVKIHRINPGGEVVEEYGNQAFPDPDTVVFDQFGIVAGIPNAILVGGLTQAGSEGLVQAILPDQSVTTILAPSVFNENVTNLTIDNTGRLLFHTNPPNAAGSNSVIRVEAGVATKLLQHPVDIRQIALDEQNRIYVSGVDGVISLYAPEGQVIDPAFATGLGSEPSIVFGTGGFWGNDLYVLNHETDELIQLDASGNPQVIATGLNVTNGGLPSFRNLAFGPDNALYLSDFENDRILRIAPNRETLGLKPSEHEVVITVADGQGGVAVQNYVVNVFPEEGNHDPSIVSKPILKTNVAKTISSDSFIQPSPYLSFDDSPFKDIEFSSFYLEDFEDGALNQLGVSVSTGSIISSGGSTDSVDSDDGTIDGKGQLGRSLFGSGTEGFVFNFEETTLGSLPTHAGIVWTDGATLNDVTFEAFDSDNNSLGTVLSSNVGDGNFSGGTNEDRFFGIIHAEGISSIRIISPGSSGAIGSGIEVDHLQYGIANSLVSSNLYFYDVDAIDPDNDTLTYSLVEAPENMTIDESTGEIVWNPAAFVSNEDLTEPIIFFAEDINPFNDENTPLEEEIGLEFTPNSDQARKEFLSRLSSFKIEDFESYSTERPTALNFGDDKKDADITGIYSVVEEDSRGNFLLFFDRNGSSGSFELNFDKPLGALAFDGFDFEIGQSTLTFQHTDGTTSEVDVPYSNPASSQSEVYFGILTPENPFTKVTFNNSIIWDAFGIDNLTIATPEQVQFPKADVTVRVEDGRGGSDEQDFTIQIETAETEASGEIRGTKFLDFDGDGVQDLEERQELINLSSRAFYNSSLGDLYPGDRNAPLATFFPGPNRSTGDPLATFSEAPDLSDISSLGDWLGNPEATIANSEFWTEVQPVPQRWTVNDETAIIYEIDAGEGSIANLTGDFGVDNGIYIWLDGEYLFGAMRGGPAVPGEYSISPVDLSPGKHYLQVLREDHGGATGYEVTVTGDGRIEPGLEDWIIYIDSNNNGQRDANELFTTTDVDGNYAFEELAPGTYILREENQSGYVQTFPDTFKHIVTVGADEVVEDIDFGNTESRINAEPEFISTPVEVETVSVNQRFRYDADAQDANGDLLTYDLSLAPEGMVVDPISGIVVWEPTINQIGTHDVILRVQDGNGGVDLQAFQVTVNNNSAPVITSIPFGPTIANSLYQYDVDAEDVDGDTLTYSLLANPDGVSIDETSGLLTWTPTDSDVGDNFIRVQVADGEGGIDTQSFTLPVIAAGVANNRPVINNSPRDAIGLGDDYVFQVEATDPDNDPLTYSLTQKPDGMTIDEKTGLVVWPAEQTQLGEYSFTVKVEDGRGAVVEAPYTVNVVQQTINGTPTITSTPSFIATIGDQYIYEAEATDPDNDPIAWSLVSGPTGLTLDETTGRVGWTPTEDQFGFHEVIIDAIDAQGASSRQGFGINVSSTNAPPLITSAPPTLAFADTAYTYAIQASDPNGDALTYSLSIAPVGMTIDETTGLIEWTPTPAQLGTQAVTVSVSDGRGAAVAQTYTLNVASDVPNQPPQITSRPAFETTAEQDYVYQLEATDPENQTIRYQLLEGPAGMAVNETTGLLTWQPTLAEVGSYQVKIAALDSLDLGATQTFTLIVRDKNQAPVLINEPDSEVLVGATHAFDLEVTDPDGDAVTYTLVDGPKGMTIDELGRLRWTPTIKNVGTVRVEVLVEDGRGGSLLYPYDLKVMADMTDPQVVAIVNGGLVGTEDVTVGVNESVVVQVRATDDVAIESIGLTVNETPVALDSNGMATLTFDVVSSVELVATAVDTSGNFADVDFSLSVEPKDANAPIVAFNRLIDPNDPEADLIDPETGRSVITSFADIIGTVDDPEDNLASYKLTATPFVGGPTTTLVDVEGDSEISEGVLGRFDGTLLRNDTYILELSAEDTEGNTANTSTLVDVEGDLKIGNYTLSFVDLSIPLTGIPIVVSRTYDTLNAAISDDFGHGWSMDLRDTDLIDNVGKSGLEDAGIYNAFFKGAAVYITLPNGEREKFIFDPVARGLFSLTTYKPRFVAADGDNTSTLTVDDIDLQRTADGKYVTLSQIPYNPASTLISGTSSGNYTLTTKDGIKYTIDGDSGDLEKVTDRNGNTLTYTESGVFSSTGKQVTFERDPQGRITAVIDPEGNRITYEYDDLGDLVAVTDREENRTEFKYNDNIEHFLEDVIDPLGRNGIRSEYRDGRLFKLFDFDSRDIELEHNPENFVEIVKDQFGVPTIYEYDARGNVETEEDVLDNIIRRTYDDADNMLTETVEKDGVIFESTTFKYDSRNNVLSETDALGNTTYFTYDSFGNVLTTTDPSGQTITNTYDANGNLTNIEGQATGPLILSYDSAGNLKSLKDSVGTTTFEYYPDGNIKTQKDALGTFTTYTYDDNGNQLTETTTQTTTDGVKLTLVTEMEYDDEGRVVKVTDAEGNVTETVYDANGNRIEEIDALKRSTRYIYDERGLLIETIYPDDTPDNLDDNPRTTTEYDEAARVVAEYDELGRATRMVYDELGRVVATVYADYTPGDEDNPSVETKYDPAGRVIAQIDELGNRTQFIYDKAGRLTETIYPDATPEDLIDNPRVTTVYDKAGRQIRQTDALGQTTKFFYDELGRSTRQEYDDGTTSSVKYDDAGRVVEQTDQEGKITKFEYDKLGRLEAVVDALKQRTEYTYDEQGNLITQKDARENVTRYEYDKLGRRTATVLPEGQRSVTIYDALGNPIETEDFNGDNIIYTYDKRYRLKTKDLPGEKFDETYTYYDNGLLETVKDDRGTTSYEYDKRNRLAQREDPDGTIIAYSYDKAGNRTSVTIPSGATTYTFDKQNRLETVTDPDNGTTTYFYNAVGNLERTEFPNGTIEIREYDNLNRLEYIENSGPNGIINSFRYTLNAAGHRTAVDEHDGRRVEYTYDDLYRLEKETIYDPGATAPSRTIEYVYDEVGNRLSRDDSAEGKTIYTYDNNDRLETATTNGVVTTYGYDNNGNTTSKTTSGNTITYNWNADNRLISADTDGDGTVDVVNQYNQNGIRVSQTVNGEETHFLIDENRPYAQVLEEYTPSGIIKVSYVHGHDLISQTRTSEQYFYNFDALGSVRAILDSKGQIKDNYTYDSFGRNSNSKGSQSNRYLFAGEQLDSNLGSYYLRQRYYADDSGRFLQRDPFEGFIRKPLSLNKYLYADGNPVNGIDPNGEYTLTQVVVSTTIIGGIVGAGVGTYYGARQSGTIFSYQTLRYALYGLVGGATAGALLGLSGYAIASTGTVGAGEVATVISRGASELLIKANAAHSTTMGAQVLGFVAGLYAGYTEPSYTITLSSAATLSGMVANDSFIRGALHRRNEFLAPLLGKEIARTTARFLFTYGQSTTFLLGGFLFGFTVGYGLGSYARNAYDPLPEPI